MLIFSSSSSTSAPIPSSILTTNLPSRPTISGSPPFKEPHPVFFMPVTTLVLFYRAWDLPFPFLSFVRFSFSVCSRSLEQDRHPHLSPDTYYLTSLPTIYIQSNPCFYVRLPFSAARVLSPAHSLLTSLSFCLWTLVVRNRTPRCRHSAPI